MNDDAVYQLHRGVPIAGKPCSYKSYRRLLPPSNEPIKPRTSCRTN